MIYPIEASGPNNSSITEIINKVVAAAKDPIIIKAPEYEPLNVLLLLDSALSIRSLIMAKGNTIVPIIPQKQKAIRRIPTTRIMLFGMGIINVKNNKKEIQANNRQIERVSFNPNFSESFFQPINENPENRITVMAIKMNSFPLIEITNVDKFKTKY